MSYHKVETALGSDKTLSFETGKLAQQASGAVVVRIGDTMVLAAATIASSPRPGMDFFPLLVDFEEKLYAVGRIPGGFFKREGKATENAILTARRIDRPIRPLFPDGFRNDVQIVISPLSVDLENPPDILAINGASAALLISDIPFDDPIGAARVAKIGDKLVLDPGTEAMKDSTMDLVVAGTESTIMMIECGSNQVSEADVFEGIKLAHSRIKEIIKLQKELAKKAGKKKIEVKLYEPNEKIKKFMVEKAGKKIETAYNETDSDKRKATLNKIREELADEIQSSDEIKKLAAENPNDVKNIFDKLQKQLVRKNIIEKNQRVDGRKLDEIRKIECEVGLLPRVHGSALFSRGSTQVLTIATLGSLGEEQRLDGLSPEETKRYMHHYNFPSYSVGEVRPMRGPGRREIGHGALAEKSLLPVVPNEEKFPYTIRLVSEVLGSNGSTSMASTCASTLALMDAGVKIESPVAGISVGLVQDGKKDILFTDIQGIEDFYGDMDFKVSGTAKGITGIQVDCKIKGLSFEIIEKTLEMTKTARAIILEKMLAAIAAPRAELSKYAPRVISLKIDPSKIGMVIGPGGKNIRGMIEETGAQIDIEDDGTVLITCVESEGGERAKQMIESMTYEPRVGDVFLGKVVRLMPFGAFVEIVPGKDGLVHVSQISNQRVARVEDALAIGDEVVVKLMEKDDQGRLNLSMKIVTAEEKAKFKK